MEYYFELLLKNFSKVYVIRLRLIELAQTQEPRRENFKRWRIDYQWMINKILVSIFFL